MKIRDIMVSEVETAEPDDTLDEVAMIMREQDVEAIPIVEEGELIGIVTDRDIVVRCIAEGKDPAEVAADEVLSGELQTVEPDSDVEQARRVMAEHQIRRLPVIEKGMLVGMVSLGDLALKIDQEEQVADTVEDISARVKATDKKAAKKQPKSAGAILRKTATRKQDRSEEDDRGNVDRTQSTTGQGIANRSADEEAERQNRVVPIRSQQKTNLRGDRSKSSSGRKTG